MSIITRSGREERPHVHGPENAEHELKKAYLCVVELGASNNLHLDEIKQHYKHAYNLFRKDDRLAAERWARTVKHLARAFWHESKLAYLEPKVTDLPFLTHAQEEYAPPYTLETTRDLLESVAHHGPPGTNEDNFPESMKRYLQLGMDHLSRLSADESRNELLRAERLKAAHEYGRALECLSLALEAERTHQKKSA